MGTSYFRDMTNKEIYVAMYAPQVDNNHLMVRELTASMDYEILSKMTLESSGKVFSDSFLDKYKENPYKYLKDENEFIRDYCKFLIEGSGK